jgi:fission 1 protein
MYRPLHLTPTSPLKPSELAVLRGQYEKEGEYVGLQTKFNYAWVSPLLQALCPPLLLLLLLLFPRIKKTNPNSFLQGLIKSTTRDEQQLGVQLLSDIFRASPDRRRECLYYLALGHWKLGNYTEARRYNDLLLELEPANLQAASLRGLIDERVQREGLVGVAIVGGLAVAAGVVGGLLMRSRKR